MMRHGTVFDASMSRELACSMSIRSKLCRGVVSRWSESRASATILQHVLAQYGCAVVDRKIG